MMEAGDWVLVRHETLQKFEAKWFGLYQILEKMLLGTYRLQGPNERELVALVRGDRLLKTRISSVDQLPKAWTEPSKKDQLRRLNLNPEWIPSDNRQNNMQLERYLFESDEGEPGRGGSIEDPGESEESTMMVPGAKVNPSRTATLTTVATQASGSR